MDAFPMSESDIVAGLLIVGAIVVIATLIAYIRNTGAWDELKMEIKQDRLTPPADSDDSNP